MFTNKYNYKKLTNVVTNASVLFIMTSHNIPLHRNSTSVSYTNTSFTTSALNSGNVLLNIQTSSIYKRCYQLFR